jgi:hypothetical protein
LGSFAPHFRPSNTRAGLASFAPNFGRAEASRLSDPGKVCRRELASFAPEDAAASARTNPQGFPYTDITPIHPDRGLGSFAPFGGGRRGGRAASREEIGEPQIGFVRARFRSIGTDVRAPAGGRIGFVRARFDPCEPSPACIRLVKEPSRRAQPGPIAAGSCWALVRGALPGGRASPYQRTGPARRMTLTCRLPLRPPPRNPS